MVIKKDLEMILYLCGLKNSVRMAVFEAIN